MREKYNLIKRKIQNELKPSGMKEGESMTFYRVINFVFSKRGLQRIGIIIRKTIRFALRLLLGKRGLTPAYSRWLKKYNRRKLSLDQMNKDMGSWNAKPLISVIIPTYNPNLKLLNEAIESVRNQIYKQWEICISDDASNPDICNWLKTLASSDSRININYRKKNGHISQNMNDAVLLAQGEYLAFLDQDDLLANDALYYVAKYINETNADILYSDEDKVDVKGRRSDPFFKPGWSPHSLISRNYINHLLTVKKSIFEQHKGFRIGFEGAQDHDFLLRATQTADNIVHIPEILYHWRMHANSTAKAATAKSYAFKAGEKAVSDYFERLNLTAKAENIPGISGNYRVDVKTSATPLVSIIIPTKDKAPVLENCLKSIFESSTYRNFEVIIIDNNSSEEETFRLFESFKSKYPEKFKVKQYPEKFNYSNIQNLGAREAKGEYLILLNNDTKVITPDWIEKMYAFAQLPHTGAVGIKLFFPNNKIQHVGVVLGIRGIVGHVFIGSDSNNPGYYQSNRIVTNYSAVTAACMMVSKEKFEAVNGFSEELAIEYNDVDFCLKLYSEGYYNVFIPDVEFIHYESLTRGHPSSSRESNIQSIKEGKFFVEKWKELIDDDPFYNKHLSRQYTEFQYDVT